MICALSPDGRVHRYDLLAGEPLGPPAETGWQPGPADKACRGLLAAVPAGDGAVIATLPWTTAPFNCGTSNRGLAGELAGLEATRLRGLAAARRPDGTPLIVTGDVDGQARWFDAAGRRPGWRPRRAARRARCLGAAGSGGRPGHTRGASI